MDGTPIDHPFIDGFSIVHQVLEVPPNHPFIEPPAISVWKVSHYPHTSGSLPAQLEIARISPQVIPCVRGDAHPPSRDLQANLPWPWHCHIDFLAVPVWCNALSLWQNPVTISVWPILDGPEHIFFASTRGILQRFMDFIAVHPAVWGWLQLVAAAEPFSPGLLVPKGG
jgi:hypothetical protein